MKFVFIWIVLKKYFITSSVLIKYFIIFFIFKPVLCGLPDALRRTRYAGRRLNALPG